MKQKAFLILPFLLLSSCGISKVATVTSFQSPFYIPKSNSKGIMAYDGVIAELSVEYKFSRKELMHEFKGSVIKIYHTDISLDNESILEDISLPIDSK